MDTEANPVIATTGGGTSTTSLHHRDFPEIRAEGPSTREAAELLLNHLTRALDSALIDWRRERVQTAIDDVRAFLAQNP